MKKKFLLMAAAFAAMTMLYSCSQDVFDLSSSDTGTYGMNTPAYFAIDDLTFEKANE